MSACITAFSSLDSADARPSGDVANASIPTSAAPWIVLIEDDKYVGAAVSLYLTKKGYAVEHFVAADKAREWLGHAPCDLVITDIFMPDSDGLEMIAWMRKIYPRLPVIAISGSDVYGNSYLKVASLMGATRVLPKPFELSDLTAMVAELVARERARP